jgi:flagellar biosynthesis regulator FlaF
MEHRYFKLQKDSTPNARPAKGQLVFSVSITDFQAKTLQILKMVRAALIYLSLSVHREETRRAEKRQGEVDLPVWELRPIADGSEK